MTFELRWRRTARASSASSQSIAAVWRSAWKSGSGGRSRRLALRGSYSPPCVHDQLAARVDLEQLGEVRDVERPQDVALASGFPLRVANV